ncbi:hypothetical protein PSYPI_47533, partial [Pseudomonas syringae pv. pisi str. 1704B]
MHRSPGQTLAQGAAQVGFMTVQRALAVGTGPSSQLAKGGD